MNFVFFGGEPLAVPILNKLKGGGLLPSLIICNPDRPSGRGQKLTPPPTKTWAETEAIEVFQPTNYKDNSAIAKLRESKWDLFVVVAYNFILPNELLKIPKKGVLNLHPSLLPKLRGASPIRTAIMSNQPEYVGVTIMLMDEKMDHGTILEQEQLPIKVEDWPIIGDVLDNQLANLGGDLLAETIPAWMSDELIPQEQNHELATYCGRINKADSQIVINPFDLPAGEEAKKILHTIYAFSGIGDTFFIHKEKRVKIKSADLKDDGKLRILRVIPEGKKEIDFSAYLKVLS